MDITASVITAFRAYYPEFSDDTVWTDAEVTRHLEDAIAETGKRWGGYAEDPPSFKARGMFAYAAHRLIIAKAARNAVAAGATPGAPVQAESKQVGDESITYAVTRPQTAAEADARGDLASTIYGQEFLRLRKRAGMGAASTGQVAL